MLLKSQVGYDSGNLHNLRRMPLKNITDQNRTRTNLLQVVSFRIMFVIILTRLSRAY